MMVLLKKTLSNITIMKNFDLLVFYNAKSTFRLFHCYKIGNL